MTDSVDDTRAAPSRARERLLLAISLALGPLLVAWPLPLVFRSQVLTRVDGEAGIHIWGLWAALVERSPVLIETRLLSFPDGVELVLVDPGNVPFFALGWLLGGPAAGFNAVVWGGLLLAGIGGAMLATRVGGAPWLGALVAMASPTLMAGALEGTTEDFGAGWVAIHLALLLSFARSGRALHGIGAALTLVMAAHSGPYNGVWAALADAGVGIWALGRIKKDPKAFIRMIAVGTGALVLTLPLAWAVLTQRDPRLPGSSARAEMPPVLQVDQYRGGLQHGADITDLWLPVQFTGDIDVAGRTAYLGITVLILAVLAVLRDRRLWPWLAGMLAFNALSLGPWLYCRGEVLELGGVKLNGPAGWLILADDTFGRLTRWYRAGAVATLLAAPLISTWAIARPWRGRRMVSGWLIGAAAACVVLLDTSLGSPVSWPRPSTPLPDGSWAEHLEHEGAVIDIPPDFYMGIPGVWREEVILMQVVHQRPTAASSTTTLPPRPMAEHALFISRALVTKGALPPDRQEQLLEMGFRYLLLHMNVGFLPPDFVAHVEGCLGAPVVGHGPVLVYDLANRTPDCKVDDPQPDKKPGRVKWKRPHPRNDSGK